MTVEPVKLFTSFSANFEDVILHRIFGDVPAGFYVDVGAAHPVMENDTKALYDQGWSGVNVEPNPALFAELQRQRPRDRSVDVALSDTQGAAEYFEVVGTGLSTLDPAEAERCRSNGHEIIHRHVQTTTLAVLLAAEPPARFDLLKIDVEGLEERVLDGNDWSRFRPSVVMVEATYPETKRRRETRVRATMEAHGYRAAYFDGLNDYYVRSDFHDADGAFDLPPNVFDRFTPFQLVDTRQHAEMLEKHLALSRQDNATTLAAMKAQQIAAETEASALRSEAARKERELIAEQAHALNLSVSVERMRASLKHATEELARCSELIEEGAANREELVVLRAYAAHVTAEHGSAAASYELEHSRRQALESSTSWRVTRPLRLAGQVADQVRGIAGRRRN